MEEETNNSSLGRRKFMRFGMGFLGGVGLISVFGSLARKPKVNKVKMLTADGKLVEIDAIHLKKAEAAPRASNDDVQRWMKKNNS